MSDIAKVVLSGRLTKDPEIVPYGSEGKTLTKFSIASSTGTKDKPQTIFNNCTCFGKYGEIITKFFNKGDQIFIIGVPTQSKSADGKYYYGVNVESWSFGQKKGGANAAGEDFDNPFDSDSIPF